MRRVDVASLAVAIALVGFGLRAVEVKAGGAQYRADRLIRKHVRALGGKGRIREIGDVQASGRIAARGREVEFTLWMQHPNRTRVEVNLLGRELIQAYDGETAWWVNPFLGSSEPAPMPAAFSKALLRWVDFRGPLVGYRSKGHRAWYRGVRRMDDGGKADHIELEVANGEVWHIFLDRRTHLEVMRTFEQRVKGDVLEVQTHFAGFREVRGVKVPTIIESVGPMGEPFTMYVDKVDFNVGVDTERFAMPATHPR